MGTRRTAIQARKDLKEDEPLALDGKHWLEFASLLHNEPQNAVLSKPPGHYR